VQHAGRLGETMNGVIEEGSAICSQAVYVGRIEAESFMRSLTGHVWGSPRDDNMALTLQYNFNGDEW